MQIFDKIKFDVFSVTLTCTFKFLNTWLPSGSRQSLFWQPRFEHLSNFFA